MGWNESPEVARGQAAWGFCRSWEEVLDSEKIVNIIVSGTVSPIMTRN